MIVQKLLFDDWENSKLVRGKFPIVVEINSLAVWGCTRLSGFGRPVEAIDGSNDILLTVRQRDATLEDALDLHPLPVRRVLREVRLLVGRNAKVEVVAGVVSGFGVSGRALQFAKVGWGVPVQPYGTKTFPAVELAGRGIVWPDGVLWKVRLAVGCEEHLMALALRVGSSEDYQFCKVGAFLLRFVVLCRRILNEIRTLFERRYLRHLCISRSELVSRARKVEVI